MKKLLIAASVLLFANSVVAQNNVGIGTTLPDPSTVLHLESQTGNQGFLVPTVRVANVLTPTATGLVVYDPDSSCYVIYTGTAWKNMCTGGGLDSIYYNADGSITAVGATGNTTTIDKAWLTKGNSGTNAATDFAGTTDAQDFVLKSNNNEVLRVTTAGAVGINTPAPVPSALVEMTSTTRGVLFPSMTTAQRDLIAAPALGLVIYNNVLNVHQFWNGTCWVNVGQTVCSFDYDLTQSQTSGCLLKTNFNSVADTLTISLLGGTPSPVVLSAAGVPAGVLVNFSNNYLLPTATSIMTFTALPSAPTGTFTITILATSGSTVRTITYDLTVYDFGLTLASLTDSLNEISIAPNVISTVNTVTIGNPGACGASGTSALLSASNLPIGVTVTFANASLSVPGTTTMTVQSSSCAEPGVYIISVNATIGAGSQSVLYELTILPSVVDITASASNINLHNVAGNPTCGVSVTFNIAAGVDINSNSTTQAALNTGPFGAGSNIIINNNGNIVGKGGDGGENLGSFTTADCSQMDGKPGGDAIWLNTANVVINNNGVIGGGGGGGGSGGARTNNCFTAESGGGGGGGAGLAPGIGGGPGQSNTCNAGANGTLLAGGAGGAGCSMTCFLGNSNSGSGGNGGNLGQPGANGVAGSGGLIAGSGLCPTPGVGGAAGCGIKTNGNGYTANGTAILGPVCP